MMRRIGSRPQRTIARPISVTGIGFITGAAVHLCFKPAPPHTGRLFHRLDRPHAGYLAACVDRVTGANRRTILGQAPDQVELVEHVLAALSGMRIDNCLIELNAPEPPGLDGSADAFVHALELAGIETQAAECPIFAPDRPIVIADRQATLSIFPSDEAQLKVSYGLDYGHQTALGRQRHTHCITPMDFINGLCDTRTFLLEQEALALRAQGIGSRTDWSDLLIFGPRGPIGNELRYADEPARHKVLDIVGDLALLGCDLAGHVIGYRSGHAMNVMLVRSLLEEMRGCQPLSFRLAA